MVDFYRQEPDAIIQQLKTSITGMSAEEAQARLKEHGPNALQEERHAPPWVILLNQFQDPLIYVLLIASVFTVAIKEYIDTWVILAVVVLNAVVGFIQEFKAEKAMAAIRELAAPRTIVIRGGSEKEISSPDIVPGDIVVLRAGERVPADARILESQGLHVDESMLTGESQPVTKDPASLTGERLSQADQKNMVFMGTAVAQGKGKAVVVATGMDTQLGDISKKVQDTRKENTPLQKRLVRFSKLIGLIAVGLSVFVTAVGVIQGKSVQEMILFSISMAVAAIPEGLPVVITITMAIGLKRMAERNAIVRRLIAVETLGSCNMICSDKTGTITENQMTVRKIYSGGKMYEVKGEGYAPDGEIVGEDGSVVPAQETALQDFLTACLLCNEASLEEKDGRWGIQGDPTEGALLVAARKAGLDGAVLRSQYKQTGDLPFDSDRKFMATLHQTKDGAILFVKGAPEKMIAFSAADNKEDLYEINRVLAEDGLRVLAAGRKKLPDTKVANLEEAASSDLEFLGFAGIMDPPRESAIQAIKDARKAGITTVMLTGDHKITAAAVARQIGILEEEGEVVTGDDLDARKTGVEAYLKEHVDRIRVFARVSPGHKLQIVDSFIKAGKVVAVTGDGVNDAPALKRSTIGVAMGKMGTDVAREASEMILKDDNFATIVAAVKEGRVIFDNIRKVVFFLLGSSAGLVAFIIASLFLGWPLPFLATQVLWVNLVTNGLQDIALAYEPGEADILDRPPRDATENIINAFVLKRLALVGVTSALGMLGMFWYYFDHKGADLAYARTVAFNMAVFFQFFHVFNSRSFTQSVFRMNPLSNPFLLISMVLALLAQIAVLTWPPLQYIFKTTTLTPATWVQTILVAFLIIVVMEMDKIGIRRRQSKE